MKPLEVVRLGSAVRLPAKYGQTSWHDEVAYALAYAVVPMLSAWSGKCNESRNEVQKAEQRVEQLRMLSNQLSGRVNDAAREAEAARARLAGEEARLKAVRERPWRWFRWLWMLFFGSGWQRDVAEVQRQAHEALELHSQSVQDLNGQRARHDEAQRDLGRADASYREALAKHGKLAEMPRLIEGVRYLDYPIVPMKLRDARRNDRTKAITSPSIWVMSDPNGPAAEVVVPTVKLDDKDTKTLETLHTKLEEGKDAILFDPGEKRDEEFGALAKDKLLGAEQDLLEFSRLLANFSRNVRPDALRVPVIRSNSPLGIRIAASAAEGRRPLPALLDRDSAEKVNRLDADASKFRAVMKQGEGTGQRFDQEMERLAGTLRGDEVASDGGSSLVLDWAKGQDDSRRVLSDHLRQARRNARLVRYHYYCPSCNATPAFLSTRYEINDREIADLDVDRLLPKLKIYQRDRLWNSRDGKRLPSDETRNKIEESWEIGAFPKLRAFRGRWRAACAELEEISSENAQSGRKLAKERELRREIKNLSTWFRDLVRGLVKRPLQLWEDPANRPAGQSVDGDSDDDSGEGGGRRSQDEYLNANSRLTYRCDPGGEGGWNCSICGQAFGHAEADLGAVEKVRLDVVYPVITELWHHDAVWREIMATMRESAREIRDRVQQETSDLQMPIQNFKNDAREIRGKLDSSVAKGRATGDRLLNMAEQFAMFELLPEEDVGKVRSNAGEILRQIELVDQERGRLTESEEGVERALREVNAERREPVAPSRQFLERDVLRAYGLSADREVFEVTDEKASNELLDSGRRLLGSGT